MSAQAAPTLAHGPGGEQAVSDTPGRDREAISVARLRKEYELRPALRGVTFSLGSGRTLALLGPNGAGKTTLLRILATLTRPTSGSVRVAGLDVAREAAAVRRQVGYVGHAPLLYDELSAEENLRFYARMYGLRDGARRAAELLERVGLGAKARERVATLSRGQTQRLALARAILHEPAALLLDEPETGLDDLGLRVLDELLAARRAMGQTTLLATHVHERGLALADEAIVLAGGRIVHAAPARELTAAAVAEIYAHGRSSGRGGGA